MSGALATGSQTPSNASGDPSRDFLDRIPGKLRVPGCCLHLRVSEQSADHRKALVERQGPAGITVP